LPSSATARFPRVTCQLLEVQATQGGVFLHRHGRAEIHAGVAEAVPVALQHQPQIVGDEAQRIPDCPEAAGLVRVRVGRQQQRAVFQYAVVIQAERHEHEIALAVEPEPAQHVVDNP
jgi:hypothetical protein